MACFSENGRLKIFNGEKNASYTQAKDATEQERTDVSGNVRSPPIDGSNEASDTGEPGLDSEEGSGQGGTDTGVERQGDNQDGDEDGRALRVVDTMNENMYANSPLMRARNPITKSGPLGNGNQLNDDEPT